MQSLASSRCALENSKFLMSLDDKLARNCQAFCANGQNRTVEKGISENMNWKKTVIAHHSGAEFASPSDEVTIAEAEKELHVEFPSDLRSFFLEAGGIVADYGCEVIWKISDIVSRNKEFRDTVSFRELYMPFDHLLFFRDDGGGDQFAIAIQADGIIHKHDVYRWEHETDARSWFASGLSQFLEKRLAATD